MQLSREQASAALAEVDSARATMRSVVQAHRGHYHLWIWGAAWIAMPLLAQFRGDNAARFFPWIAGTAGLASAAVGFAQGRQIRLPVNARFLGLIATLVVFAAIFPFVLRIEPNVRTVYAYICLVALQGYVVAGLWTDSYLLWLGLAVSALVLAGVFLFPAIFWWWMALCGGGTLLVTGFYVRHFWR